MKASNGAPFDPKIVFGLIAFGALAFFATLYFIGTNQTGGDINDGGAHAAGKGLTGFAAFADFLESEGHDVVVSRSKGGLDDYGLLVLTPPSYADAEDIDAILDDRLYQGPTMVILPKWDTLPLSYFESADAEDGWVQLYDARAPIWADELSGHRALDVTLAGEKDGNVARWGGLDTRGQLPSGVIQSARGELTSLIFGSRGGTIVGYVGNDNDYPDLANANGVSTSDNDATYYMHPVIFVVDPDLINNYGFAQRANAEVAHRLVDMLVGDNAQPVVFDLTLNGLGAQQNLLTLAFRPPFLAATLCLILALL
ncbi:MAG: DUF4350 domain-containing protein, partial [Pontixanthobacter sp.]